jgi:transcriptional regulator with XRE-family HTH domain
MPSMLPKAHWEQFGAWVRKMRREADLTQKQVADQAGIHEVHVARIEKGESGTKRETVLLLAKALGVDKGEALQRAGFSLTEYPLSDDEARSARNQLAHRGKPQNLPELLEALSALGIAIDWATIKDNFEGYTPDDFEDLKEQIAANAGVKIKRVKNR